MLTPDQYDTLKNIGLVSLLTGTSIPLLASFGKPLRTSAAMPNSHIELPVQGIEKLPDTEISSKQKRKITGSGKKIKEYKPGAGYAAKEKAAAFSGSDLLNPYYLPSFVVAGVAPGLLGNYLVNKALNYKKKKDLQDDEDIAREGFNKSLVEAAVKNSPAPMSVVKQSAAINELVSDLNELADLSVTHNSEEKTASQLTSAVKNLKNMADLWWSGGTKELPAPSGPPGSAAWNSDVDQARSQARYADELGQRAGNINNTITTGLDKLKETGYSAGSWLAEQLAGFGRGVVNNPYGKGYLGLLGALALGSGGLGAYYGFNRAKKTDREPAESYRYLTEFLRRQQEQGTPIYVTPTPIKRV